MDEQQKYTTICTDVAAENRQEPDQLVDNDIVQYLHLLRMSIAGTGCNDMYNIYGSLQEAALAVT